MAGEDVCKVAWVDREEYIGDEPVTDLPQLLRDIKAHLYMIPGPQTVIVVKKINKYLKDNNHAIL